MLLRRFLFAAYAVVLWLAQFSVAYAQSAPYFGPGSSDPPYSLNGSSIAITIPISALANGNGNNIQNTALGMLALSANTQSAGNVAIGYKALNALNTGSPAGFETAVGRQALMNDTAGTFNTSVGSDTMRYFTGLSNAAGNIALGHGALGGDDTTPANNTTSYNTALGAWAGQEITTSPSNTLVGMSAGVEIQTGSGQNVMIGQYAGSGCASGVSCTDNIAGVTTPTQNVFVGFGAGWSVSTGQTNVGVGYDSMEAITTGQLNTAVGRTSLATETTGVRNVAIGENAGQLQVGNNDNTFVGEFAGRQVIANQNVCIGSQACTSTTTGASNVIIGYNQQTAAVGTSNEINVGGIFFGNNNSTGAPAVSSCGTSPSIDAHANNVTGQVTAGTGSPTSCTVTFAGTGYGTWNHCQVTAETSQSTFGYSYTTTVLTITGAALTGKIDYDCQGV